MMYIITETGRRTYDFQWRIGQRVPLCETLDVTMIQADGDELDMVRANFKNIPDNADRRVVVWRGVFAQFIFENLK